VLGDVTSNDHDDSAPEGIDGGTVDCSGVDEGRPVADEAPGVEAPDADDESGSDAEVPTEDGPGLGVEATAEDGLGVDSPDGGATGATEAVEVTGVVGG